MVCSSEDNDILAWSETLVSILIEKFAMLLEWNFFVGRYVEWQLSVTLVQFINEDKKNFLGCQDSAEVLNVTMATRMSSCFYGDFHFGGSLVFI